MGYVLRKLGNLPIDDTVTKYIFLIKPGYHDELSEKILRNFFELAKDVGDNAVLVAGSEPEHWLNEVGTTYFGPEWSRYESLMPALLVTDAHPDRITESSERIVIPLDKVPQFYSNWSLFLRSLAKYARGEASDLKERIARRDEDYWDATNKIFSFKPNFLGFSINVNELLTSTFRDGKKNPPPPLIR